MKIYRETSLADFEPWSGAVDTYETVYNAGKMDELESIIEELYPDGIDETQLNDILWFEDKWVFEVLGIDEDDEEESEG